MNAKQKFSDRFLPRKVSKQEKYSRAVYKSVLVKFTKYGEEHGEWLSFKECFSRFKDTNFADIKRSYGSTGLKVLEVMEEQVNNAK